MNGRTQYSLKLYRPRRSKPNANEVHKTKSILNSTNLQNSMYVHHPIHLYTVDRPVAFALSTDRNIILSTRGICVKYARFVRSALQRAGSVYLSLEIMEVACRGKRIVRDADSELFEVR